MEDRVETRPGSPPPALAREEAYALAGIGAIALTSAAWWALALWPAGGDAPAWLARTRLVCFGVTEHGLPDLGGWINLVGQPLGMLAALVVGWWGGVRGLALRYRASRHFRTGARALALLALAGALAAGWRVATVLAGTRGPRAVPMAGASRRLDRAAPPLALIDQHGEARALADFRGRPVLLAFAYGHCQTVCPLVVRDVLEAQRRVRAARPASAPAVLVVTLDPWRDTPARLRTIATGWKLPADAYVLGGSVAAVNAVLDAWAVPRRRAPDTGELTHPALVYVLDMEGRIAFTAPGDPGTLTALVRRL